MKMEQIECSETSAYKIQTPGNFPEESTQQSEEGESLKSRMIDLYFRLEQRGGYVALRWREEGSPKRL